MTSKSALKRMAKRVIDPVTHQIGRLTKRYYFEDFIRVYPEGVAFNRLGLKHHATKTEINNYRNHCKFYDFCSQFVAGKQVADVGCGSGYGCEILVNAGAQRVAGCDISHHALNFARKRYGAIAEFTEQGITQLNGYRDAEFDVVISSEVLEHIKEYGLEDRAVKELKRITRAGGLIIVGTPNSELLDDHGFSFDEIHTLFKDNFATFCIFENALIPFGAAKAAWERRLAEGRAGVVVTENVDFTETVIPEGEVGAAKQGVAPGSFRCGELNINTTRLHNTHSWVVVAQK